MFSFLFKAKATYFFVVRAVAKIISGRLIDKMIIIVSVRVDTSKKYIGHRVKETYTIISTQVTHKTNHISLLCDSIIMY